MDNVVLYRKYRPESFADVFGQDHIIRVIEGSLQTGKIGHAYLFSGPHGTGKTSVARIFAKTLGCSPEDIIEIDAASHRGVDDIRSLREAVRSLPFSSEYKVYIIDEVHMLTKEAFNALLKTLEEPPLHVIFILATTEFHKVLPTIVSRCQSFFFKSPQQNVLKEMVEKIVEKEGFEIDKESLELISFLGNGSFRDTQGVLQKLISYSSDKKIRREETELILGAPSQKLLFQFISALEEKNIDHLFQYLKEASSQNIEASLFLQMLIEKIRSILKIRFSPSLSKSLKENLGGDEFSFLSEKAQKKNGINAHLLSELLSVYQQMSLSFIKYLPLELAIFRLFGNNTDDIK